MDKHKLLQKLIKEQQYTKPTPAYKELGLEPGMGGKSLLHDESGRSLAPQKQKTPSVPRPPVQEEKSVKIKASGVPPQHLVQSGGSEEQLWFNDRVSVRQPIGPQFDENEEIDIERLQGQHFLDIENQDLANSATEMQENYNLQYQQPTETTTQTSAFPLEKGEFAVLVDGEIVEKAFDLSSIRSLVEKLLFTYEVDIKRIDVIKNINIDFGIILSN